MIWVGIGIFIENFTDCMCSKVLERARLKIN